MARLTNEELGLTRGGTLKMYFDPFVEGVFHEHPDWTDLQIARQARILRGRYLAQIDVEAAQPAPPERTVEGFAVFLVDRFAEGLYWARSSQHVADMIQTAVEEYSAEGS